MAVDARPGPTVTATTGDRSAPGVAGISQKPVRRLYSARGAGLFATAHFSYFGMIVWFPPGEPGCGITGVVAAPRWAQRSLRPRRAGWRNSLMPAPCPTLTRSDSWPHLL